MKPNNRENKAQTQNQNNNGINPETGALIRIKLQHGTRRATGTGGTSRARADIAKGLLMVCSCATTEGRAGAARGSGRGGTAHGGGTGAGATSSILGVRTRFSPGGHGGGGTGRDLFLVVC